MQATWMSMHGYEILFRFCKMLCEVGGKEGLWWWQNPYQPKRWKITLNIMTRTWETNKKAKTQQWTPQWTLAKQPWRWENDDEHHVKNLKLTKQKGKETMINTSMTNTFGKKRRDNEQRMIQIEELDLILP
jgi:hypothetical protein